MKTGSSLKRQKSSDDRISTLPNSVISYILSLLPTISAFATSFLSKSWELRWTEVTTLDFDDKLWPDPKTSRRMSFVEFVNMVLDLLVTHTTQSIESATHITQNIEKFRLRWEFCEPPSRDLNKWIDFAIARKVRVLELDSFSSVVVQIPGAIYTCGTLEVLKLKGFLLLKLSTVVWLPKLAVMELIMVKCESDECLHKLISGCPVLESLTIKRSYENMPVCKVSSPVIKRLHIYTYELTVCRHFPAPPDSVVIENLSEPYSLEINAPALEFLTLHDSMSTIFSLHDVGSDNEVELEILGCGDCDSDDYKYDIIVRALEAFQHAKSLKCSGPSILAAQTRATNKLPASFGRLTKLVLNFDLYAWTYFLDFIHLCEKVEVLHISCLDTLYKDDDEDGTYWVKPYQVPVCLSLSLRQVSFRAFGIRKERMHMLEIILKNGLLLERVDLYSKRPLRSTKRIAEMHQASSACKISYFLDN